MCGGVCFRLRCKVGSVCVVLMQVLCACVDVCELYWGVLGVVVWFGVWLGGRMGDWVCGVGICGDAGLY